MTTPLNRFTVQELTPRGPSGSAPQQQATYELTRQSVSPTRIVGRDKRGRPIEETINTHYSQLWVHPSGTINSVPMRTGAVFSMGHEAVAYEAETTHELLTEGWIPLRVCPYTPQYRGVTGTPFLIDNSERIEDCGGDEANGGCVHLKAVIAARAAAVKADWDLEVAQFNAMTAPQAKQLVEQMTQAMTMVRTVADEDPADVAKPPRRRGGE